MSVVASGLQLAYGHYDGMARVSSYAVGVHRCSVHRLQDALIGDYERQIFKKNKMMSVEHFRVKSASNDATVLIQYQ